METLQNAYRDDDDDDASVDMDLSPNSNLIPDPTDPNLPHALGSEASSSEAAGMAEALGSELAAMAEAPSLEVAGMAETAVMAEAAEKSKLLGSETALMNEALGSEATGMAGKGETLGLERIGKVEALGSETTGKVEGIVVEEISSDSMSESEHKNNNNNVVEMKKSEGEDNEEENDDDETTMETSALKKQKSLSLDHLDAAISGNLSKKPSKKKSKSNSVWTKPTSRKGKKKAKNGGNNNNNSNNQSPPKTENEVLVTPMPRFPDKNDDNPESKICLSKVHKAEKVELSEDRLSAGSCKGYRMVRATRGVSEGAWYFEIKVVHLGDSGHTRLGWSNERGDLQAPVGYDGNSFGYRDIDGCKIHKALRDKYGDEGYKQGDVIGFYINLPEGESYAPKGPHLVLYKGQKYVCASNSKEDPPKCVPGSEISFFKNGVCQGVAFKDLYGGRYYPAASMYTLPNQPNCVVKFNFGPDFECFPADFEGRPVPRPMIEVPYHGYEDRVEDGVLDENKQ